MLSGVSASSHLPAVAVPAHVAVPAVRATPVPQPRTGRDLTTRCTAAGGEAVDASCARQPDRLRPTAPVPSRPPDPAVSRRTGAVRDHRARAPVPPAPAGGWTTATTGAVRGGTTLRLPGVPRRPLELDA